MKTLTTVIVYRQEGLGWSFEIYDMASGLSLATGHSLSEWHAVFLAKTKLDELVHAYTHLPRDYQ